MEKYKLPFMCPKYLTDNHLWDGEWLEKNNKKEIKEWEEKRKQQD
jgi:hypothetical protein